MLAYTKAMIAADLHNTPNFIVTEQWLNARPNVIFVYGDNTQHTGTAGAAMLRYHPQAIGFITKRYPSNASDSSFFRPDEYIKVFEEETTKLLRYIEQHPDHLFIISKLGAGLANRFDIWEEVIQPNLKDLLSSVEDQTLFLW